MLSRVDRAPISRDHKTTLNPQLREIVRQPQPTDWFYGTLLLDSPGGSVREAFLLAQVVRDALLETTTYRSSATNATTQHWPCVSACFLVWVAGTERSSMSGSNKKSGHFGLGLHRPFFEQGAYGNSPAQVAEMQQTMTESVRAYLRREQVPELYVEKMLERSSREVFWLHESGDLFALNGRAPWFEEMMIARCKFDPVYDREFQARDIRLTVQGKGGASEAERKTFFQWRQTYNTCEYEIRQQAQRSFRK